MPVPATTPNPPPLPQPTAAAPAAPVERRLHAVDASEAVAPDTTAADTTAPDTTAADTTAAGTEPSADAEPSGPGALALALAWLRASFTPGSGLYHDRQPSIAEGFRRAREGAQLADKGPLRTVAIVHGYAAATNKAVCDTWKWIFEHPARLAVFSVLLGLAVAFPVTRHLLSILLTPIVWVQEALD